MRQPEHVATVLCLSVIQERHLCQAETIGWYIIIILRGGADKSLARPTSRCRKTESIVSLERGVCSCAEL